MWRDPKEVLIKGKVKFDCATSLNRSAITIHRIRHEDTRFVYKPPGAQSLSRKRGWEKIWKPRIEVELKFLCGSDTARSNNLKLLTSEDADCWITGEYWAVVEKLGQRRWCPLCERIDGEEGYTR